MYITVVSFLNLLQLSLISLLVTWSCLCLIFLTWLRNGSSPLDTWNTLSLASLSFWCSKADGSATSDGLLQRETAIRMVLSHWCQPEGDVPKSMILPRSTIHPSERPILQKDYLIGIDENRCYQRRWYYHKRQFFPTRDWHWRGVISLVKIQWECTRVDDTTVLNGSSHWETDTAKTVSQWQRSLRNVPKSTILPRQISLRSETDFTKELSHWFQFKCQCTRVEDNTTTRPSLEWKAETRERSSHR